LSKRRFLLKTVASSLKTFSVRRETFSALFNTSFLVNMEGDYAWDRRGERVWRGPQKVTGTPRRYPNILLWA